MQLARFLGLWLAFGLRGSLEQANNWQVVAQTALPGILMGLLFQAIGVKVPVPDSAQTAAFIGYGLLAWVAFRLLVAPYFIWKKDQTQIADLNFELAKPLRIELEYMATARASARMKLSRAIRLYQWYSFQDHDENWQEMEATNKKMVKLHSQIGDVEISAGISLLHDFCQAASGLEEMGDKWNEVQGYAMRTARLLEQYLHGQITSEVFYKRLPSREVLTEVKAITEADHVKPTE